MNSYGWFCVIRQAEASTCHWTKLQKGAWAKALDLYTNDRESEVERLIKIGATRFPGDIDRTTISSF